MLLWTYRLFDL